ncbi:MAG: carboxypeptidase regulatory-like domain-containing protein [Acidobacteriota bacterium]
MRILRLSLLAFASVLSVYAQTASGRFIGTVADSTGGHVAGATVNITNEKTGEVRTATTDAGGTYVVTQLLPSTYSLKVSHAGFSDADVTGFVLGVGQEIRQNLTLEVAGVNTTVVVEGGALAHVDTSSARVGVNISEREVAQLPLNGRQVSQLYLMAPGAVNSGSGTFDNIRFSGRSNQQNAIRFDGVEASSIVDASPGNLNGESTSNFRLQQSLENVQEFRVDTSNYPAEYGTGTGGQVSFVTKSGGNVLHGSAFEYLRNDALDARNFFSGSHKDKLRLNQFGGSLGGPIVKDKLFVFGSYEALRQRTATPFVETTLSPLARSQAVASIQPLLSAFPSGGIPSSDPLLNIVTVNGPGVVDENSGGIRIDYNPGDKYRFYLRYFRDQGVSSQTQNSTLSKYNQSAVPQNAVISSTQTLSATVLNEAKIGFNGVKERVSGVPGPSPGVDLTGVTLNLSGSVALAGIAGQSGNAGIAVPTGLIRLSSAFNGRGAPYTNYSLSFIDNLSVVRGQHNMKFGVEIRPVRLYNDQQGGTTYSFPSVTAFLNNAPSSVAFNGTLSDLSPFTGLSGNALLKQTYNVVYAQDEWHISPNFTLSYGLRYEYYTPLHEDRNKNLFFDITKGDIIPKYTGDWYHSSKLNFGPRLGLSWSPESLHNTMVLRIGAGYYYGPGQTEDQLQPEANDRISSTFSSGALNKYPLNIPAVYANYNINSPTLGYQPRAYAPGYKIPEKILSYTASVQQEILTNTVLTVAYVGSQGRNLFLRSVTNKIVGVTMNPTTGAGTAVREFGGRFAEIDYKTSGGTSHYNAMQVTLNRRMATGLSLAGSFTWAHDLGNTAGSNEANTAGNPYNFQADFGSNNFDIRRSFNLTTLYQIPYGRGKKFGASSSRAVDSILGGWQLGGIVNARAGVPMDVLITRPDITYIDNRNGNEYTSPVLGTDGSIYTTPVVNTLGGGNSRNIRRPDVIGGVNRYLDADRRLINPAAFTIPLAGTFGNSSRNSLIGPGLAQFDLTVSKSVSIGEKLGVEFRAEIYNIFNHTNFANPANLRLAQGIPSGGTFAGGVVTSSGIQPGTPFTTGNAGGNFGVATSTVSNQIGLGTNRQLQLSLRLSF